MSGAAIDLAGPEDTIQAKLKPNAQRVRCGHEDGTMATLIVITDKIDQPRLDKYLLSGFFKYWEAQGHRILLHHGGSVPPGGDIAILHVDQTVIDGAFLEGLERYPVVINGAVLDISKKRFSQHLLRPGEDYSGPVISKTNLNSSGAPERRKRLFRLRLDKSPAGLYRLLKAKLANHLANSEARAYRLHDSLAAVPSGVWRNEDLVVEKFLPEQDEQGYYLRTWTFFGDRERCSRVRSADPIVKGRRILDRTTAPVPDELRAWRARLKFDYGKFDFVVRDGDVILYDVNRTPTLPGRIHDAMQESMADLAAGLESFLKR